MTKVISLQVLNHNESGAKNTYVAAQTDVKITLELFLNLTACKINNRFNLILPDTSVI